MSIKYCGRHHYLGQNGCSATLLQSVVVYMWNVLAHTNKDSMVEISLPTPWL